MSRTYILSKFLLLLFGLFVAGSDPAISPSTPSSPPLSSMRPLSLFHCPSSSCSWIRDTCQCRDSGFSFKEFQDVDNNIRELGVIHRAPFSDHQSLSALNITLGDLYQSILLKCNYSGPLSDLLEVLGTTNLVFLTVEEFLGEDALAGFSRLPFRLRQLRLQLKIKSLPSRGIPSGGFEMVKMIKIYSTRISTVPNDFFTNVRDTLHSITFNHNKQLGSLQPVVFAGLSNLQELRLTENSELHELTPAHLAPLSNLTLLHFNDDNMEKMPPNLFAANLHLANIAIRSEECRTDNCTRSFNASFFQHLHHLSSFSYSAGDYIHASFAPDTFSSNPSLSELSLESCHLLPANDLRVAQPLSKLRILRVVACELHSIGPKDLSLETHPHLESVTLGKYNEFFCDSCVTVDALWELSAAGKLQGEVLFECKRDELGLNETKTKYCMGDESISIGGIVGGVSVAGIFTCVMFCIVSRWRRKKSESDLEQALADSLDECEFDVFVSYAEEDDDCAARILSVLEEENNFRCLQHHRDFDPGPTILENIAHAVTSSRLTLLVVSRHFLRSQWCERELTQAESRGRHILVVMRVGGIPAEELNSGIARHVASHVYLEEDDPDFAQKLADAVLKSRGRSEPAIGLEGNSSSTAAFDCLVWSRKRLSMWREQMELTQRDSTT